MEQSGVIPDAFTFSAVAKVCRSPTDRDSIYKILDAIKALNIEPDEILYNCLIDACLRTHETKQAVVLYDAMIE